MFGKAVPRDVAETMEAHFSCAFEIAIIAQL